MPEDWNPTLLRDIEITTEQAQQDPTAVEGNPLFPEMENFVLLEEVPFRKKWDQFKANRIVDRVDENTMAIIEMEGSGGGGISDTHNVAVRIPQPGYYQPNQVIPFPPLGPGRGIHVQILGHTGAPIKTAVITFGGPLGVRVRHGSWIFGWVSSSGGSYGDVAYKYVIVGEVLGTSVIRVDELPNPEVTTPDEGALYLVNSTGFMYVWNPDTESFQNVGEVIPGTYVSQSEFRDEFDVVVVPEPGRFYYDNTSEIYYRWNGSVYIDIAYSEGGTTISLSHLTENSVPRYSPQTGRLEDSEIFSRAGKVGIGTMEPTEALEVNGRTKTKAVLLENEPGTPANNTITRTGNQLKFKDDSGNVHILNDEKLIIPISPFDEDIEVMDCQPITAVFPFQIVSMEISVGTAPSGADINVGIKKNATDVTPTTRAIIPNGQLTSIGSTPAVFTSSSFAVGDIFKPYIAQVGSTTPGKDLNLILTIRKL